MIFTSLQCSHGPGAKTLCIYLAIFYIYIFFIIYNQKEKLMTNSHLPIMNITHWMSSHFISTQFIAQGNGSDNTAKKTWVSHNSLWGFQQIKVCKPSHGFISWFYQKLLPNSQPNTAAEVWVSSSFQSQPSGRTCECTSTAKSLNPFSDTSHK